jgi:hypothetical protein
MPIEKTANYIRVRVASPSKFRRFRVKTLGKGIRAIIGFRKAGKGEGAGGSQIQSFLFPRSRYTLASAKAWIKSHGYSVSESWLVTDIMVGEDYLEFEETLITPEMEAELLKTEHIDVTEIKKEIWEWLFE